MTRVNRKAKHGPALTPKAKGELAERMVPVAAALACAVRDEDAAGIGALLDDLTAQEQLALFVVLAAMVPVDQPVADLLDWVCFDEDGRPLPGSTPMLPEMPLKRSERRLEYARLRAEGLTLPAASRALSLDVSTAGRYETAMYEDDADAA